MKIDTSLHDDYAVLALQGEFDNSSCPILLEEVDSLAGAGVQHLIVDMGSVQFINSTALGAIITAQARCKGRGGDLVVDRASPFVCDIAGKLGVDQVVPMYDTEQEATDHIIEALNSPGPSLDASAFPDDVLYTKWNFRFYVIPAVPSALFGWMQ